MAKIKSLSELKKMKDDLKKSVDVREKGENSESMVKVKVSMATCGIAAGAKDVMNFMLDDVDNKNIDNILITQTGCMGLCHSEPTIEVTKPDEEPVIFGNVDNEKAGEIIDKYIVKGELVDGIIPQGYKTIEE